jgi:hypothetical protein
MLQPLEGFIQWLFFENCYTDMIKEFPMCASPNTFCECLDFRPMLIVVGPVVLVALVLLCVRILMVRRKA